MIIGQPTYGFPQVKAEIAVINASWKNKKSTGLADSVGLMVYQGTYALNYVKNYADASKQWSGFPIKTDVPKNCILLGAKGNYFLSYSTSNPFENKLWSSFFQSFIFLLRPKS